MRSERMLALMSDLELEGEDHFKLEVPLKRLRKEIEDYYREEFAASLKGDAALKAREPKRESLVP